MPSHPVPALRRGSAAAEAPETSSPRVEPAAGAAASVRAPAAFSCPHCGNDINAPADPIFDDEAHDVIVKGNRRHLSPMAWKVLAVLRVQERFITDDELRQAVWGRSIAASAVATRVSHARDALRGTPLRILNRSGIGYRLVREQG